MPYFGVTPAAEFTSKDLNGEQLILDADADTTITADTDDQIDIRIAGADDFQFTANTFTALSGSTVAIASGATIANSGTATGFGVSLANDGDNRVVTGTGSGLNGEANLSFDGSTLAATGNITATGTIEPAGDTAASDNAAFGYTSVLGAILTGQGSTNDVTLVNDADATVLGIATGTTNVDVVGDVTAATITADGDTAASDKATMGYTASEGLILTGQGSTDDITIKNDADTTVVNVATGATDVEISAGNILFGTSSKGIYLGVTSATAANLLDDYEEGTWTPLPWTDSSQPVVSGGTLTGHYTKIGRKVFIVLTSGFVLSSVGTGTFAMSGLPFTSDGDNTAVGILTGRGLSVSGTTTIVDPYIPGGNNKIYFNLYDQNAFPAGQTVADHNALSTSANGANFNVTIVYEV